MPVVTRAITVPANGTVAVDLSPFDRFGLGGGAVQLRAATAAAATLGDILANLTIGSDQVARDAVVPNTTVVNNETPSISGVGAPADPITVTLQNTTATARLTNVVVDIQNV